MPDPSADDTGATPAEPATVGEGATPDASSIVKLERSLAHSREDAKSARAEAKRAAAELAEAQERISALESEVEQLPVVTAERDDLSKSLARMTVARDVGLPDTLAERLKGDTEEEMREDAAALVEAGLVPGSSNGSSDTPRPVVRSGDTPDPDEKLSPTDKLARDLFTPIAATGFGSED